jgi:hypothetical protein
LRPFRLNACTGDRYAAQWVVEAFSRHGVAYRHSDRDRSAIYLDALPIFTSGRVQLLDNPRLVHQFAALERRSSTSGRDRVDHGPHGHDDLCNAAAGALTLAAWRKKDGPWAVPVVINLGSRNPATVGGTELSALNRRGW